MSNIAIIPARGGSKRIPRKNIKHFLGKPIIAYSIEAALESKLFDVVMVSTDDEEIAEVAKSYGASVPFRRSAQNADDYATTASVLLEVLETYKKQNKVFDNGCCIYPTAPFVTATLIKKNFHLLAEKKFDVVFPAVAFGYPVYRGLKRDATGLVKMIWPENETRRSQDLPKVYHDAGQLYWFKCETLFSDGSLFTENTGSFEISDLQCQDIDNETDWKLAELKFQMLKK